MAPAVVMLLAEDCSGWEAGLEAQAQGKGMASPDRCTTAEGTRNPGALVRVGTVGNHTSWVTDCLMDIAYKRDGPIKQRSAGACKQRPHPGSRGHQRVPPTKTCSKIYPTHVSAIALRLWVRKALALAHQLRAAAYILERGWVVGWAACYLLGHDVRSGIHAAQVGQQTIQ